MEVYERIKDLRKNVLKLSQTEFGKKLGVTRSVINNIEGDRLKRPDQKEPLYKLICKEFNINYLWLTEGVGYPRSETPDDLFDEIKVEYDLTDDDLGLVKEICELDAHEREELKKYIRSLIKAKKEEN